MKTKFTQFVITSSLLIVVQSLFAQVADINTNPLPLVQTVKYQDALENDRSLGEQCLLTPGLKEKLRLTDEQRAELKPFEDDFAITSQQYQAANQPRIDAAQEAIRHARETKGAAQIQAARVQLQQVWAGLKPDRDSAIIHIKPLLTPDQITILEDPKNQWRESHGAEANDPSAN
jgi:hypothetical protein